MEFESRKSSGKGNVLLILGIVAFFVLISYFVYNNYLTKLDMDKKNSENANKVVEKDLDINSGKVLNLYDLVKYYAIYLDFKDDKEETVLVSDISFNDMFNMVIANINSQDTKCDDIKSEIKTGYNDVLNQGGYITCGDNEYDATTDSFVPSQYAIAYTKLYLEKDIKSKFHQIFGGDYYKKEDKINSFGKDFFYVSKLNGYVEIQTPTGGIGYEYASELVSAKEKNNDIILVEKVTYTDSSLDAKVKSMVYDYKYTFKYNDSDESYYFYSLEKTKR